MKFAALAAASTAFVEGKALRSQAKQTGFAWHDCEWMAKNYNPQNLQICDGNKGVQCSATEGKEHQKYLCGMIGTNGTSDERPRDERHYSHVECCNLDGANNILPYLNLAGGSQQVSFKGNSYGYSPEENFHKKFPTTEMLEAIDGYGDDKHWYFSSWGYLVKDKRTLDKDEVEDEATRLQEEEELELELELAGQ